tara:strand:- start:403 stop:1635 length:1233 start_codon:yes stop_codon:yes gene_type:complete
MTNLPLKTDGYLVLLLVLLCSCASPIRNMSHQELLDSKDDFVARYQDDLVLISTKSAARLRQEYVNSTADKEQSYDILVLSGGGEMGAFGAGFLHGWGKVEQGEYQRPDFDSVTGISTGALIAPFAFVGSKKAYNDIVDIYQQPNKNMVIKRMFLAFLAGNDPYYDATKLHQTIRDSITANYVKEIAENAKQNKLLIVGATNLDFGVMRAWDLGSLAINYSENKAKDAITTRLIASSAIPGAFPPVNINKYLYVDGAASMQMLSGIDDISWLYNENTPFPYIQGNKPVKIRIWVIINNKLVMDPEITKLTWSEITKRSIVSLMHSSILQTIQGVDLFARMANTRKDLDVQMHFVAIPQNFNIPITENLFDPDTMHSLIELGKKMGANPNSWQKKTPRPGASIIDVKNALD